MYINKNHVVERTIERDVLVGGIKYVLRAFVHRHLCLFIYEENLSKDLRPFKINIVTKDTIVCLNKVDTGLWRLSTVLDTTRNLVRLTGNKSTAFDRKGHNYGFYEVPKST